MITEHSCQLLELLGVPNSFVVIKIIAKLLYTKLHRRDRGHLLLDEGARHRGHLLQGLLFDVLESFESLKYFRKINVGLRIDFQAQLIAHLIHIKVRLYPHLVQFALLHALLQLKH